MHIYGATWKFTKEHWASSTDEWQVVALITLDWGSGLSLSGSISLEADEYP